ncbi:hypothetical protein ACFX2I_008502 [Malus domestica]
MPITIYPPPDNRGPRPNSGENRDEGWNPVLAPLSGPLQVREKRIVSSETFAGKTSGLVEFRQPTRPIDYKMSSISELASIFPYPTKPVSIDNMTSTDSESFATDGRLPRQFVDHEHVYVAAPPTTPPAEEEDREAVDGLRGFISEFCERVPARIAEQLLNMDGNKGQATVQKGATRGLQGSMEELSHKLERFKIRTLDIVGVVKEEEKQ